MNCHKIPKLQLPATVPFRGQMSLYGVCTAAARTLWFSLHLAFHRSAVSFSALNVYSMIQTIDPIGIGPQFQFLHPFRADPVLLTLLIFSPVLSSYWVLHGSIYSFPLVRYSCLLSGNVLITLLCLKVYAWCTHEGCTPHPLIAPPSVLSSHESFRAQNPQW